MKDISLRPKVQLMNLFEGIKRLESLPSVNRNAIVARALHVALKHDYIDWQAVSEVNIPTLHDDKMPAHIVLKVDGDKFEQITTQIKAVYTTEKITIPYTLKLLLTLYFIHLTQQSNMVSENGHFESLIGPDVKIDTIGLKYLYEQAAFVGKKRLLEHSKTILKNHAGLRLRLRDAVKDVQNKLTTFFPMADYLPKTLQGVDVTEVYLAKVLSGVFIYQVEQRSKNGESKVAFEQLLKHLDEVLGVVGVLADGDESADYYRNVYAKMMGGKL